MPEPAATLSQSRPRALAFTVHVLTASGAALALLALVAATERHFAAMFAWLALALIVDAIDGPLARRLDVAAALPRWSGDRLDLVVDILTYVFVPAYAVAASGLLPDVAAVPLAALIVVTGSLYFADRRMKRGDNCFIGFPAAWNAVAFYLFLLRPPIWLAAAAVLVFAVMTFLPIPFVHPFRVQARRWVSVVMLAVGAGLAALVLAHDFAPDPLVTAGLSAVALYFLAVGVLNGVSTAERREPSLRRDA